MAFPLVGTRWSRSPSAPIYSRRVDPLQCAPALSTAAMTQQTVLNATHRALGAKMVDFGGWDMPPNYGSQIEEHHAVRRDAGMFDVSHMLPIDLEPMKVHESITGSGGAGA